MGRAGTKPDNSKTGQMNACTAEEDIMEYAAFVVKALVGGVLSEVAKGAYRGVVGYLKDKPKLGGAVAMLEENPEGETEQKLLAERLVDSDALSHPEFRAKVDILVQALKNAKEVSPQARVLIEDIKANEAYFRRIETEGGAGVTVKKVEADILVVEDITVKS